MKLGTLLSVLLSALLISSAAQGRELVIAVSPYMEASKAKERATQLLQFLTGLEPGDNALLLDGYNLTTLGTFNVPESASYNSARARLNVNGPAVSALMTFAQDASLPDGDDDPSVIGAVHLPQLLHHVATNYPAQNMDVIILGSPFFDSPSDPQFSMSGAIIPSDGHLRSSRKLTPFGAADNPDLLRNLRVHMAYGDAPMQSDRHSYFVERFWTLYAEQQGGSLVTFTADLPTLFNKVKNNADAPRHDYELGTSEKLEMILLRPRRIERPIYERPITSQTLPPQLVQRAEQVELGLSWDCLSCDIDLYARPFPGAEVLYFNHTSSPQGTYWKDYRQSPRATNGKESIEFNVPLDLRVFQIAVNFYEGEAPGGVDGELRLAVADKTYAMPFHIDAQDGNKGAGVRDAMDSGQSNHPQTLLFNLQAILGGA